MPWRTWNVKVPDDAHIRQLQWATSVGGGAVIAAAVLVRIVFGPLGP